MDTIRELTHYLRKERIENEAYKYKQAIPINWDYNPATPFANLVQMEYEYFKRNMFSYGLSRTANDKLIFYIGLFDDDLTYKYYERRKAAPGALEPYEYRRFSIGDSFSWAFLPEEEVAGLKEIVIDVFGLIYYDRLTYNLSFVLLDTVIITESFSYDPNHLAPLQSGVKYEIEFEDHKGNTTRFWDNYQNSLLPGIYQVESVDRSFILNYRSESGLVKWYPRINNGGIFEQLTVSYYYTDYFDIYSNKMEANTNMRLSQKFKFRGNLGPRAIELKFNSIYGLLTFLNETVLREEFDFNVDKKAKSYNLEQWFVNDYVDLITDEFNSRRSNIDDLYALFFYIPKNILKEFPGYILWDFLTKACLDSITNFGIDKEVIVLHVLGALSIKEKSKFFLDQLLKPIRKSSHILELLIFRLHGDSYTQLVYLIWSVWARSNYFSFDPSNVALPKKENNPLLIPYKSDTTLSFHTDNAAIYWKDNYKLIEINFELPEIIIDAIEDLEEEVLEEYDKLKTSSPDKLDIEGVFKEEKRKAKEKYSYHPFCPILIVNKENPKFIFKGGGDEKDYATIMPAFVLLAREQRAFWGNLMTLTEYLIDILSIAGGLGIFLKVGRFAMAVSTGDSILLQGIKQGVVNTAATIYITSGVGRGLLKLTETRDTPLGRAISEVLFYIEIAAVIGHVGVGVHAFIQRSAQKALTYTDEIEKIYREVDELTKKNTDKFDNVTKTDDLVAAEERLAGIRKLEEMAGGATKKMFALWKINSQAGKFNSEAGKFNCGNTAIAVEYTLAGKPASALPWTYEVVLKNGKPIQEISYIAGTQLNVLEKEFGKVFIKNMTPNKIQQILKPGQRGIVFGIKKGNKLGHFFNAVNEKGVIKFLDGQKVVERASDTQKARLVYDYYEFLPTNF